MRASMLLHGRIVVLTEEECRQVAEAGVSRGWLVRPRREISADDAVRTAKRAYNAMKNREWRAAQKALAMAEARN
jgi:hypothetical protein